MLIGIARRAFGSHRIFCDNDILERMRLFREERDSVQQVDMFRYPDYLREINAKDLQIHIQEQSVPENVALLHSIAHIQFNAFSAYADTFFRFRKDVPHPLQQRFQTEVSKVALEEAHHFRLLHDRLVQLRYPYGSLPVINGLTRNIAETSDSLLDRVVVISLVQEGKGLDASDRLLSKIRQSGDIESQPILRLIATEEVGHVAFGVNWVTELARHKGVSPTTAFREVIGKRKIKLGKVNKLQRQRAGFPDQWFPVNADG